MSDPDEHHNTTTRECATPGRRRSGRAHPSVKPSQRQARDICPKRPRLLDPDHEAFVEWFVSYWRRQGAKLFTGTTSEEA